MNGQETTQQAQTDAAPVAPVALPAPPPMPVAPAPAPIRRSPGLAVVLSCFPGLGHLYLGLYQRAAAVFFSFVLAIWLSEHSFLGILVAGVVLFGFVDAYRQAQALNLGLVEAPVAAPSGTAKGSRLGFGLFLLLAGAVLLYNQFYPIDFTFLEDWWPLLLVLAGVYMVFAHFREKRRLQAASDAASGGSPKEY